MDLSLNRTGFALYEGTVGVIAPPRGQDDGMPRLSFIRKMVWQYVRQTRAKVAIIEEIPWGAKGKTFAQIAGLHYVIRLALFDLGVATVFVNVQHLKIYATGHGQCKVKETGGKTSPLIEAVHRLGYQGGDDNEADALWLLHMGQAKLHGRKSNLPITHTRALNDVDWTPAGRG